MAPYITFDSAALKHPPRRLLNLIRPTIKYKTTARLHFVGEQTKGYRSLFQDRGHPLVYPPGQQWTVYPKQAFLNVHPGKPHCRSSDTNFVVPVRRATKGHALGEIIYCCLTTGREMAIVDRFISGENFPRRSRVHNG